MERSQIIRKLTKKNVASDYCNVGFVDNECSSSDVWPMSNADFQKVTYAISGTNSNLTSEYGTPYCANIYSMASCGYGNDLIDNGGYYWFAANSGALGVGWDPDDRYVIACDGFAYGLRPIISLSSSVYVTGGSGTMEDPWQISNDYS